MAKFIGTVEEFIAIFGGTLLTKAVSHYTRRYKKMVKTCTHPGCNKRTCLEAAHNHENNSDRLAYAESIINCYYPSDANGNREIDLDDFMKKFFYVHLPLNKSIKALCKDHHSNFDKGVKRPTLSLEEIEKKVNNAPKNVDFNANLLPIIKCKNVDSYRIDYMPDKTTFLNNLQSSSVFFCHIYITDGLGTVITKKWITKPGNLSENNLDRNIRSNSFVKTYKGNIERVVVSMDEDPEK